MKNTGRYWINFQGAGIFDRFTTDAINTDGAKAVYEIGDLIKQVRANDPAQAEELLDKTRRGIAPDNIRLLAAVAAEDADGEQTPEADNAGEPSATKAEDGSPELPKSISMDEHGQYYDADGKPITNPDKSPNLQKAQIAAPMPGAASLPGGTAPVTLEDGNKISKRAGEYLDKLARDPDFLKTPLGKAMIMQGMFKGMIDGDRVSPRTDIGDPLPDRKEFPADPDTGKGTTLPGRSTEPDRAVNPPPFEPPIAGEFDTPPSEGQSGDPELGGAQVLEFEKLHEPVDFAKGGKPPEGTQKALDALDPATAQLVKEVGLSDGSATHGNAKGIHIEMGKPESQRDADFRAMVRKFGDDPDGARVEHVGPGRLKYESPTGVIIMARPSKKNGLTLEIQVPSEATDNGIHQIKRRYGKEE